MGSLLLLGMGRPGAAASPISGALVKRSSLLNTDFTSVSTLQWASAVYDSDGFYSGGANTKLTVPAQFNGYYAVVTAVILLTDGGGTQDSLVDIKLNGNSNYNGKGGVRLSPGGAPFGNTNYNYKVCQTHPIQVSTGDYFEVDFLQADTNATLSNNVTSFGIRIIGNSIDGCLLKKSADQTAANYSGFVNVAWNTEVYDTDGYHDNVTQNTRITIPAGANGKYGIFRFTASTSSVSTGQGLGFELLKGGVQFLGGPQRTGTNGSTTTTPIISAVSPPILLTTGDYFEAQLYCQDTSITVEEEGSFFSLEVLPSTMDGCLVKKSADQTTANYSTPADIAWDAESFDTQSFHDNSIDNNRITIPASMNGKYGIFYAVVNGPNFTSAGTSALSINKNGSQLFDGGAGWSDTTNFTTIWSSVFTQPVLLTTGDYYTAYFYSSDTSITVESDVSAFGLQVIP